MARPLRIEYSGAIYHITSRGNARLAIYEDDEDRRSFIKILENIFRGPLAFIKGVVKILMILFKERPDILFSTGSEIAAPAFYFGRFLFRAKLIYLECSAQVYQPSLTGRVVYPITDLFLVQWEPLLKKYGPKAKYIGGLI